MKFLIASSFVALLASPAFAADNTIFASNENPAQGADSDSISLEGFNGGVSTTDTHDGNGAMVIQMLMPSTASAVTGTPGPFVARAAVSGSH